jgi:hypothetical protein
MSAWGACRLKNHRQLKLYIAAKGGFMGCLLRFSAQNHVAANGFLATGQTLQSHKDAKATKIVLKATNVLMVIVYRYIRHP